MEIGLPGLLGPTAATSEAHGSENKPGVFFINILHTTFSPIFWRQKLQSWNITIESCTKHFGTKILHLKWCWNWLKVFFFINILWAAFLYVSVLHSFSLLLKFFIERLLAKKLLVKCWWNWQQKLHSTFQRWVALSRKYISNWSLSSR